MLIGAAGFVSAYKTDLGNKKSSRKNGEESSKLETEYWSFYKFSLIPAPPISFPHFTQLA